MSGFHFGKLPFDCPEVDLEINSVNEGSFAAGSTINLTITDGTNPVTPESVTVVGNDVEVVTPEIDIEIVVNGVSEPIFQLNPYENNTINITA